MLDAAAPSSFVQKSPGDDDDGGILDAVAPSSFIEKSSKKDPDDDDENLGLSSHDMKKQYDKESADTMLHSLEADDAKVVTERGHARSTFDLQIRSIRLACTVVSVIVSLFQPPRTPCQRFSFAR